MSYIHSVCLVVISCFLITSCSSPKQTSSNGAETSTVSALPTDPSPINTITPPSNPSIGTTWLRTADNMTMVYVPASEFLMGTNDGQSWEAPAHKVYLDAFWIDQTEVTSKMYALCMDDGACLERPWPESSETHEFYFGNPEFDNYPVINVNWLQAKAYCEWRGDRLPTEAEWEKAASWDESRQEKYIYPWGNTFNGSITNLCDTTCIRDGLVSGLNIELYANDGYAEVAPVGNYIEGASPYGAMDMAGNVSEWVNDWFSDTYYEVSPFTNPQGPESAEYRVVKGGNWGTWVDSTSSRIRTVTYHTSDTVGFRCARSVPETNNNVSISPLPVSTVTESPTNTSSSQLNPIAVFEWSIETGELYILGSASDGNLYGLTSRSNYVIMSPKGEIILQAPIQEIRCRQGENYQKYAMHYLVRPDGNILCVSGFANDLSELTLISPANPPTLNTQFSPTAWFYPYLRNDQLFPSLEPEKPSDFDEWMFGNSHLFLASGDERKIYLADRGIGFIGRNNEFKIIPYPADFDTTRLYSTDMSDILVDTSVLITPWDDLYISYPLFDAIGNQNGSKTLLIKENGENIAVQAIPDIPTSNYYFPEREELYYLKSERKNLQLYRLDKNLNIMAIYKVSSDIYSLSQYALDTNDMFVGHDNALYYWLDNTLYKYKLVGDNIATNNSAPAAVPTTQSSTIVTPSPASSTTPIVCSNFTSQLQPNMEAKVITDAINMREKPGTNQTIVGIIYAGDKVQLSSEPPICGDGYLWWKVQGVKSGITGWVVEGIDGERWLSP